MRIAFSGTHCSGKTSLLERVAGLLPRYATVDEPYYQLEEEGYETAESPSIDDFEAQLERSVSSIEDAGRDVLFDRCPADILAYLLTHEDVDSFEIDAWGDRVSDVMSTLDLVVFVGIEEPDRIAVPSHEDRELRLRVHEKLEELLDDFDVEVLRVEGGLSSRVEQVMRRVAG